jgi:hypothetical protein
MIEINSSNSKSTINIILLLVCFIIIGSSLRFYSLGKKTFWEDEGAIIACAKYHIPMYVHPPLYNWILGFILKLFGESQFSARLLSVFSGILFIPLIYIFCYDFFDKKTAFYTTLFSSVSAYAVQASQELRMYITSGLLSFATIYLAWKFFDNVKSLYSEDSSKNHVSIKKIYFYLVAYSIVAIASIYTMHAGFITILTLNIFYFIFLKGKFIYSWLISHLLIIISYLPQLETTLIQSRGYKAGLHLYYYNPLYLVSNLTSFLCGYTFLPIQFTTPVVLKNSFLMILLYLFVSVITVISIILIVLKMKNDKRKLFFITSNYVITQIFFMTIFLPPNHMVAIQPIFISIVIYGLLKLNKTFFSILFMTLIALNTIALDKYYKQDNYIFYPEDWKSIVKIIEEKEKPGDNVYVGGNRNNLFTFRYYYKGSLTSRTYLKEEDIYILPKGYRSSRINITEEFVKTFDKSKRLWVICGSNDPNFISLIQKLGNEYYIDKFDVLDTMSVFLIDKNKKLTIPFQK